MVALATFHTPVGATLDHTTIVHFNRGSTLLHHGRLSLLECSQWERGSTAHCWNYLKFALPDLTHMILMAAYC